MPLLNRIDSVALIGAGHCGRQIAFLMARVGIHVFCIESTPETLAKSRELFEERFSADLPITWTSNGELVRSVDLVLESLPESLVIKREALRPYLSFCDPRTILASNSSYLSPSMVFRGFPYPERFASLHFHIPPWFASAVDVMPASRTDSDVIARLSELVVRMELTPIVLRKEFPGYVFNNLLHPLLVRALELVERGVCEPEDVERSWRAVTHMPVGPFGMMLEIGLPTMRQILDEAVNVLGDATTARAHRYIHRWDGVLNQVSCSQILRPKIGQATFSGLLGEEQDNTKVGAETFSRFELVWRPVARQYQPTSQGFEWSRLSEQLEPSGSCAAVVSGATIGNSWVWPLRRIDESNSPMENSDLVTELIRHIIKIKEMSLSSLPSPLFIVLPVEMATVKRERLLGVSAMLRSCWQELKSLGGDTNSCSLMFLEVDIQSASSGPLSRSGEVPAARVGFSQRTNELDRNREGNAIDNADPAEQLLHVHQRYHRGEWQVQKLRRVSNTHYGDGTDRDQKSLSERVRGSRWLISGGGRGITFLIAKYLGEHGAVLHLLGRTPKPSVDWSLYSDSEIRSMRSEKLRLAVQEQRSVPATAAAFDAEVELSRNLTILYNSKIDFHYYQVDVLNLEALQSCVRSLPGGVRAIDGILHGAGVEQTSLLSKKSASSIGSTIESKVRGALNLESVVGVNTRWFVQFGSLSGYFGGVGQVDYAAANGFLGERTDCLKMRWPDIQCLTIGWPGWDQIGMAARASSRWALQRAGHSLLSVSEGLGHFRYLLENQISGYVLICKPDEIPNAFWADDPHSLERPV